MNEIKFEQAESAKKLVGKTMLLPDGRKVEVIRWEGQNYILRIGDKEATYPVATILDQVAKNIFKVL